MVLQRVTSGITRLEQACSTSYHHLRPLFFLCPSLYRPSGAARFLHSGGRRNQRNQRNTFDRERDIEDEEIPFSGMTKEQKDEYEHQQRMQRRYNKGLSATDGAARTTTNKNGEGEEGGELDPWGYLFSDGKEKKDESDWYRREMYKSYMEDDVEGADSEPPRMKYTRTSQFGGKQIRATAEERAAFNEILTHILMRNEQQISQLGTDKTPGGHSSPLLSALFQGIRAEKDELSFKPTSGPNASATVSKPLKKTKGNSQLFIEHLGLLRKCITDLEVWNFLEDHVFSLVSGSHRPAPPPPPPSPSEGAEKEKSASSSTSSMKASRSKENFTVPAENYADMIEAAMYILRVEFQDYGGSVSVFERVKQLGAESYVVGCSTGVYNELIEAQWAGYRDMQRIGEILHEMQSNGIVADAKTSTIIERAILEAKGIACNTDLAGGAPLWANIDAAAQVNHVKKIISDMGFMSDRMVASN